MKSRDPKDGFKVRVDKESLRELKIRAAKEGTTMVSIIRELLFGKKK